MTIQLTGTRGREDLLSETRRLVVPALRTAFAELDSGLEKVCSYHQGWINPDGGVADGDGGKLLRPALAFLAARAAGGEPSLAVPGAVAVEMVHAFSLLHDDIMDRDVERRHRPTAWTVFGVPMTILAGDALLALSQSVLHAVRGPSAERATRRLTRDILRLVAGQRSDLAFEQRHDVTVTEYVTMAINKTGALMASSCAIGAELAGGPATLVDALSDCGDQLGLAFQIVDDVLGIWGDPATTGKPVLADLRLRKKSYPVLAAMEASGATARRLRKLYVDPDEPSEDVLAHLADLVDEAGGRDAARRAVRACVDAVDDRLSRLPISRPVHEQVMAMAVLLTERAR